MLFVVCNTIPPHVLDSQEFKNFVKLLNADYIPTSATTFADKLVPDESVKVQKAVISYLRTCQDLTITYDGGKIRRPKAFYSVHITTADREEFCIDLDDASLLSHTADYIDELLDHVSEQS